MEIDWKKMGFKSEQEYKEFMDAKMKILSEKLMEHIDVFTRLADR